MKKEFKYRARRLIATIVLVGLLIAFTTSVLIKTDVIGKAIDAEFERQDLVLQEHFKTWGVEK